MARTVKNSRGKTPKVAPLWIVGAVVLVGVLVWVVGGKTRLAPAGINEVGVLQPESVLGEWNFEADGDMGNIGWVAKSKSNAQVTPNASNFATIMEDRNGKVLPTTLEDGWLVIPGTVDQQVFLTNSKTGITLPEDAKIGNLEIKVVASAVIPPTGTPRTVGGVTLPGPTLKGRFQFGNGEGAYALEGSAKPEVSGTDMVYSFKLKTDELKKLGLKTRLAKDLTIWLSGSGMKLTQVKVDSITIAMSAPEVRPSASAGGGGVVLSGTIRPAKVQGQDTCQFTSATDSKVKYVVVYKGPAPVPMPTPSKSNKGCPTSLYPYLRVPVSVTGTTIGTTIMNVTKIELAN